MVEQIETSRFNYSCMVVSSIKIFWYADRLLGRILLGLLALYRAILSPDHSFWAKALAKPPYCRHIPSCSSYAVTAIERFGGVQWGWMALRRLGRCVPWRAGGYDPVPEHTYALYSDCQCGHVRQTPPK